MSLRSACYVLATLALRSIQLLIALEIIFLFWTYVNRMAFDVHPTMVRDVRGVLNASARPAHGAVVFSNDAPPLEQKESITAPSPAGDSELAVRHDVISVNVSSKPKEVHNIFYLKVTFLFIYLLCLHDPLRVLQHDCILRLIAMSLSLTSRVLIACSGTLWCHLGQQLLTL